MTAPSPHLGLEDLIARLDDAPMDDAARMHLFSCPACRAEAARWKTAADGVRTFVGSCAAPPWQSVDIFSAPRRPAGRSPWRSRPSRSNPLRRRYMLAISAGALALAIGAACVIGSLAPSSSPVPSVAASPEPSAPAVPTAPNPADGIDAVTGCSGLELTTGTLSAGEGGTTLEVAAAAGGVPVPVPVETSGSTQIMRQEDGSASDIANGDRAAVRGTRTDWTVAASVVGIAPDGSDVVPIPAVEVALPGLDSAGPSGTESAGAGVGLGLTTGTVEAVSSGGFTLATANGTEITVTTSTSTPVVELVDSQAGQLIPGYAIAAVGILGADDTLVADAVVQQTSYTEMTIPSPSGSGPVPRAIGIPGAYLNLSATKCSPSAIAAEALTTAP